MSVNEVKIKRAETAFEVRGTGPPTSRTFVLGDEDHTLGNALRHVLVNDPRIDFAGYCVPHPSEPVVHLRVQTVDGVFSDSARADDSDDEEEILAAGKATPLTAIEALKDACHTLSNQCDYVLEQLEIAMPEVKADRERLMRLEESIFVEKQGENMEEEEEYMEQD